MSWQFKTNEIEDGARLGRAGSTSPVARALVRETGTRYPGGDASTTLKLKIDMKLLKAIRTRRSISKVRGDVSDRDLRKMVDAGLCAPNHKLSDPLTFLALRGDARVRLGEVWGRAAAEHNAWPDGKRAEMIAREAKKPLRAPLLLAIAVRTAEDPVRAEEDFATAAAATQNVLLAAHALGYGAIWRTGDMVRAPAIVEHLGLAATDRIVGIVYIGELEDDIPNAHERDIDKHLTIRT